MDIHQQAAIGRQVIEDLIREGVNTKVSDDHLIHLLKESLPVYLRAAGMEDLLGHPDQRYGAISYAQRGEDLYILSVFEAIGMECKSYLDIGAHHPSHISNTKLLYERGARGVNVEANPALIPAFFRERPSDLNLNVGAVPDKWAGDRTFFMVGDTSGRNTFSLDELARLETESEGLLKLRRKLTVPCIGINTIILMAGGSWPDFLNIDAEGLDLDILKSADFSKSCPVVICVESRPEFHTPLVDLLHAKGFGILTKIGDNLIFLHLVHHPKFWDFQEIQGAPLELTRIKELRI